MVGGLLELKFRWQKSKLIVGLSIEAAAMRTVEECQQLRQHVLGGRGCCAVPFF